MMSNFPNKKYKILYIDSPWEYKQQGSVKGKRGMAKQHYKTMSLSELVDLPVLTIAYPDSILFMWVTWPMMSEALYLISKWGFRYVTAAFIWVKKNKKSDTFFTGMGAYTRSNSEPCLLAVGPKFKAGKQILSHSVSQIVYEPIEQHSKKPAVVRDKIVELVGCKSRIELFARDKVKGWFSWGDQI